MSETAEHLAGAETVGSEDQARARVYTLLGALMAKPPTQPLLRSLSDIEAPASEAGSEMVAAWAMLKRAAERAEVAAIEDEYQELFIGVGRGELVPYGSWYVTGFLMEQPLAELRVDLRRLGFERQENVHEPEDHVAALCETMSLLAADSETSLQVQRQFFDKHIAPWMGRFFGDLTSAKSASFYRAVGLLGQRFIQVERTYLSMPV